MLKGDQGRVYWKIELLIDRRILKWIVVLICYWDLASLGVAVDLGSLILHIC